MNWTTRVPTDLTRRYGVEEIHSAVFEPIEARPDRMCMAILLPECELQVVRAVDGIPVAMINRPPGNRNARSWLAFACVEAKRHGAWLHIGCDTAKEAERAAKRAGRLLPTHKRVAIERLSWISGQELQ
jgi:hypothetical protein